MLLLILALAPLLSLLTAPLAAAGPCSARPSSCNSLLNSSYISTFFAQSRPQIEGHTKRSFDVLLKRTNPTSGFLTDVNNAFWPLQNGWTAVADYDALRGTKVFAAQTSAAQDAMAKSTGPGTPLVNGFNDDAGWAALANLRAHEAYGEHKYLDRAIAVWQVITEQVLQKGYTEGTKNPDAKLARECSGKSMIGGVYWVNGFPHHPEHASGTGLNAVSTGLYALLSAELCQITGKIEEYCAKAYRSMQWLDRHLVAPDGLIWDNMSGKSCQVQTDEGWKFTYNAGLYISTYALLSSLTSNGTALDLSERTAKASLITARWNGANGIIDEGKGNATASNDAIGFKSVLIRALYRSHRHFKDQQLKDAVLQYINIQYYGLTQLAADSKTAPVEFGRNWAGPEFKVSTWHTQLAAMDVLNAIHLNPDSAFRKKDNAAAPVIKNRERTPCPGT